jgi:hypothetical protein
MDDNFSYHLLFVGIDKGVQQHDRLEHAEEDAEAMQSFFLRIGLRGGAANRQNHLIVGDGAGCRAITDALDEVRNVGERDLLLIYWAGHLLDKHDDCYFVTSDTQDDTKTSTMVALPNLVREFYASRHVRNRILVLDTCYAGAATLGSRAEDLWNAQAPGGRAILLCASGPNQRAREGPNHGVLTDQLLASLRKAADGATVLDLFEVITATHSNFVGTRDQKAHLKRCDKEPGTAKVPIHGGRDFAAASRSADPLEQALGYATRAFRDYLEQEIVRDVELIFFLSYDVWDGCLIYDGRVSSSIEQLLLEYIRNRFLDQDRLRSRFEDWYLSPEQLGVAGQCFRRAVEELREPGLKRNPVGNLEYCGDLRLYTSEYSEYDTLLGLRCCLYIPVTGPFVPPVRLAAATMPREPPWGEPIGGVLVAASHKPYGLVPTFADIGDKCVQAQARYKELKNDFGADWPPAVGAATETPATVLAAAKEFRTLDSMVSGALREAIRQEGEVHTFGALMAPSRIDSYLSCIGGVYVQRSRQRCELRRLAHPKFVKAVTRRVKEAACGSLAADKRKQIVAALADEVQEHFVGLSALEMAERLRGDGIGKYKARLRDPNGLNLPDSPDVDELIWDVVVLHVWRQLRVERRLLSRPSSPDHDLLRKIEAELKLGGPVKDAPPEKTWDHYVEARATRPAAATSPRTDGEPARGHVAKVQAQLVNALMDDFRDRQDGLVETFAAPLKELAPISEYLASIAGIEALLPNEEKNRCLRQLAHAVQVWLLGTWLLEAAPPAEQSPEPTLKEHVRGLMCGYLRERSRQPQDVREQVLEFWQTEYPTDLLALYWGLLAATHDLAIPVQRFGDWCRSFFESFFGEKSTSISDNKPPALLDFFHHPKFPFYKNSITSLYTADKRDWIESVFYLELSKHINHALVGSLIVIQQLESGEDFPHDPGAWRMLIHHLSRLSRKNRLHPEQGLFVPAYLGHAIAFSHLPELRRRWKEETSRWDRKAGAAWRGPQKPLRYSQKAMEETRVSFEDFPLTYLLALCEVLIDSAADATPDELWVRFSRENNWRGTGLSPFYVRDLDSFWQRDRPVLRVGLSFWEERRIYPPQPMRRPSRGDIDNLERRWEDTKKGAKDCPEEWIVYDQDAFEDRESSWEKAVSHLEPGVWADLGRDSTKHTVRVTRLAYEVLRMRLRLREFASCYTNASRLFQVRFNDVNDGRGHYIWTLGAESVQSISAGGQCGSGHRRRSGPPPGS